MQAVTHILSIEKRDCKVMVHSCICHHIHCIYTLSIGHVCYAIPLRVLQHSSMVAVALPIVLPAHKPSEQHKATVHKTMHAIVRMNIVSYTVKNPVCNLTLRSANHTIIRMISTTQCMLNITPISVLGTVYFLQCI